jgi:ATP-binding cassette subfamily C protein
MMPDMPGINFPLMDYFDNKKYGLLIILLVFLIVSIVQEYIKKYITVTIVSVKAGFVRMLSEQLYEAFALAKWHAIINRRKSDIANALTNELKLIDIGTSTLLQFSTSIPLIFVQLIICFFISPYGTICAVIAGIMFFYFLRPVNEKLGNIAETLNSLLKDSLSDANEHLNGIKEVKSYGAEQVHIDRFSLKNRETENKYVQFVSLFTHSNFIYNSGTFCLMALFVFMSLTVFSESLTKLIILFVIFLRIWPLFSGFQMTLQFFLIMFPAWESFFKVTEELKSQQEEYKVENNIKPLILKEGIEIKDLSFSYDKGEKKALNNINLKIPVNSNMAITGHSGSGKSTLIDILTGLLEPGEGEIFIDGIPLRGEKLYAWRRSIGFVPQETFLFHGTVRENLLWAKPSATEEEIWHALELSASDFIKNFPLGLETPLGDRGTGLSGGERQRIALARAILRNPCLLILDEATSSLDVENESKIFRAIEELRGKITIITIAHRISTIKNADEIILLDGGSIVERGTFYDLQKKGGKFSELVKEDSVSGNSEKKET